MYSGFITPKRVVKRIGVHQKFDAAGYQMVAAYFRPDGFPKLKEILHFEGFNGPDGIKVKSLGEHDPSHMYDPITGTGVLPRLVNDHYQALVATLRQRDLVRAAFEAAWLAHYVGDGLTPAHHFPYDEKKAELFGEGSEVGRFKKHWHWMGGKGVLSTHLNFEMGVATLLLLYPIRLKLDEAELATARRLGPLPYFQTKALEVAQLDLYDRFYQTGWTVELASAMRKQVAPLAARTIGIIWLLAYVEAGLLDLTEPHLSL